MKIQIFKEVWYRFYFPLLLNISSIGVFLWVMQNQVAEQQIERYRASLESMENCLIQMQNALHIKAYDEVKLHQEYAKRIWRETNTYLQSEDKSIPIHGSWKKGVNDIISITVGNKDFVGSEQGDWLLKLRSGLELNEKMLSQLNFESQEKTRNLEWGMVIALVGFGVSVFQLYAFFIKKVYKPLERLKVQTTDLMNHSGRKFKPEPGGSLLEPLTNNIICYHESVNELRTVLDQICAGKFQQDTQVLESFGAFGNTVLQMNEKIQANSEEEQKRIWSSKGLEDFARILRQHEGDSESLCQKFISSLVPFIGANQGGIFIQKSQVTCGTLELKAAYAWGRQKHIKKVYEIGEGLIGQVALEQDILVLTDVPENFITIGSGLGDAKPNYIIILPIMGNGSLQGVLELASFHCLQEFEVAFLKNLCESIGATLFTLKVNEQTRQLLERANESNMHLRAQEEELRQSTEELMSTQEEMLRKETELNSLFSSINYALLMCELNIEGKIIQANRKFSGFFKLSEDNINQVKLFQLVEVPERDEEDNRLLWESLLAGKAINLECRLISQENLWISASISPVLNKKGEVQKLMLLGSDISEKKKAELEFVAQAEAIMEQEKVMRSFTEELKTLQAELEDQIQEMSEEKAKNEAILEGCVDGVVSFNEQGKIEYFNRAAEDLWEITREEAMEKNIQDFIPVEILVVEGERLVYYVKSGARKILDARTEVPVRGKSGQEMEVLLTLTRAKVEGVYTFTAFAQKVAVELF